MKVARVPIDWSPDLPVFASDPYLRQMGSDHGWLGGFDNAGTLACILPFVVVRKGIFRLVRFPVETIPLRPDLRIEDERAFLNAAVAFFRDLNADVIVPATFNSLFRTAPDQARSVRYENIVVDLAQSEELLWQAVHHKHRNVIRNAMRQGVTIRAGLEHLDTAYELTLASFLRSAPGPVARLRVKSRLNRRDYRQVVESLGEYVQVLIADQHGIPQCAAVVPFSRHSAYYMHGGGIAKPVLGASNLLQWEAMRRLREMGVARYNFFGVRAQPESGSKAEGLRKFKERFGGKVLSGFMWKVPLHRGRYALYELAAWLRNGGDVVDQEQRRVRLAGPLTDASGPAAVGPQAASGELDG